MFKIIVVVIVVLVIGLFAIGAYKAEKVVAEKARLALESSKAKSGDKNATKK
jgi:hypothetical protein